MSEQPRRRHRDRGVVVPEASFSSYYGRQIVKPAPWDYKIATYLYTGGLSAGTGLLASGAELSGRRELQRAMRIVSLAALGASTVALVADLGRPERFLNMLRTVKVTSPMSLGSWILAGFGGFASAGAAAEIARAVLPLGNSLTRALPVLDRSASLGTASLAGPLAAYTSVLLSNTATPTWHGVYRELPFVFVGSAMAASGGAAMITTSVAECGPARRMAIGGAVLDLLAFEALERNAGVIGEPLHTGTPGRLIKVSKALTIGGAALTAVAGRWRPAAVVAGLALNAGSVLTRFGVFHAGIASAKDPRYVVVPQRDRLASRGQS